MLGPPETAAVVEATLASLAPDIRYRLAHHDDLDRGPQVKVTEVEPDQVLELGAATVRVGATDHRTVEPTVAYRVEHDGRPVVLGGDGVPCAGLSSICAGADAYVQTVIRPDLVGMIPNARIQDILDYHSSVQDAARTAAQAGVGTLVLTHYVPPLQPGDEEAWRELARPHFDGDVVLGADLTTVEV